MNILFTMHLSISGLLFMFSTDEKDEPKKLCLLAGIINELSPKEATCHPNEKYMIMEKIRIKGRKPKSSVEEGCKHIENGFPKIKEGPKANVMSIKKTNLVGSIVICEPEESEMEGINNVSINNNDDEASVVDKGKGNMIQTNEELESSSSSEGEVLAFASHFLPFPYDALQFEEGASKFFEDGTDSRLELNIGEGIEENLFDEFYFPPDNVQVSISFCHCT